MNGDLDLVFQIFDPADENDFNVALEVLRGRTYNDKEEDRCIYWIHTRFMRHSSSSSHSAYVSYVTWLRGV